MALVKNISIIKSNSKTFYLASAFLPAAIKNKVLEVYAFCRLYDDIVDLNLDDDYHKLQPEIKHLHLNEDVIRQLKIGIDSDRNFKRFDDTGELIQYSYRVAGCVGLLMCELIDVENSEHKYHAIDLGIAMQLTNICRDISEDVINGRVYIPKNMLHEYNSKIDNVIVFESINKLLALSEKYYESALKAVKDIPFPSRFSILLALRLYQAIGKKIKKNKKIFLLTKINTTKFEKFLIFIQCLFEFILMHMFSFKKTKHDSQLHKSIKDLPFTNEKI